jgi:hypothetical protein
MAGKGQVVRNKENKDREDRRDRRVEWAKVIAALVDALAHLIKP